MARYRGNRLDTNSLWYGLYNKSIELGMWNPEALMDEIGFERDREIWEDLDDDEREQIRRILVAFLDGEFEVGDDAVHHLQTMMDAPCLDDNEMKQIYMTSFALTEHKHTQFLDIYIENVMDGFDDYTELNPRSEARVPIIEATGVGEVFEHQGELTAKAAETHDPVDIARAAACYHLDVEGILARTGFFAINKMSANAPLPLLNRGFKFISTDEGRHLTHGVRLLQELLEKERAGEPGYEGVGDAIVEVLNEDTPPMAEFAYMITDSVDDPLEVGFGELLMRGGEFVEGMYNESLGLEYDSMEYVESVRDRYQAIDDDAIQADLDELRRSYDVKRGA
ncbi:MAG: ribonucleotide-diphosphate reductase subunit beta [Halobacteriales archaeon]